MFGIPSGTQSGDWFAGIVVQTPVNLIARQKDLLKPFEQAGEGGTHLEFEGFFTKIKEFWEGLHS